MADRATCGDNVTNKSSGGCTEQVRFNRQWVGQWKAAGYRLPRLISDRPRGRNIEASERAVEQRPRTCCFPSVVVVITSLDYTRLSDSPILWLDLKTVYMDEEHLLRLPCTQPTTVAPICHPWGDICSLTCIFARLQLSATSNLVQAKKNTNNEMPTS